MNRIFGAFFITGFVFAAHASPTGNIRRCLQLFNYTSVSMWMKCGTNGTVREFTPDYSKACCKTSTVGASDTDPEDIYFSFSDDANQTWDNSVSFPTCVRSSDQDNQVARIHSITGTSDNWQSNDLGCTSWSARRP